MKKLILVGGLCALFSFSVFSIVEDPVERRDEKDRLSEVNEKLKEKIDSYNEHESKEESDKLSDEISELAREKVDLSARLREGSEPDSADYNLYSTEEKQAAQIQEAAKKKDLARLKSIIAQEVHDIENQGTWAESDTYQEAVKWIEVPTFNDAVDTIRTQVENSPRRQILKAFYLKAQAKIIDLLYSDKTKSIPLRQELIEINKRLGNTKAVAEQKAKIFQARIAGTVDSLEAMEEMLKARKNKQYDEIYKALLTAELVSAINALSIIKEEALSNTSKELADRNKLIESIDRLLEKYEAKATSDQLAKAFEDPNAVLKILSGKGKYIEKQHLDDYLTAALKKLNEAKKLRTDSSKKDTLIKNASNALYLANQVINLNIDEFIEASNPVVKNLSSQEAQDQYKFLQYIAKEYERIIRRFGENRSLDPKDYEAELEIEAKFNDPQSVKRVVVGVLAGMPVWIVFAPLVVPLGILKLIEVQSGHIQRTNQYKKSKRYAERLQNIRKYMDKFAIVYPEVKTMQTEK